MKLNTLSRGRQLLLRNTICLLLVLSALFLAGFLAVGARISAVPPVLREYTVKSDKISAPVTVAMLSDLHGCEHGENNRELISSVEAIEPDLILLCGDMINHCDSSCADIYVTAALVEKLAAIAPVYYSYGNHELERVTFNDSDAVKQILQKGAILLNETYTDIEIAGVPLRIGGIYTPNNEETHRPDGSGKIGYYTSLCTTDRFVILMEHRPGSFTDQIYALGFEPDLVLSGHLHGGHVILPLFGPVWGANSGIFPKYSLGKYELGGSTLIVSAGLSTEIRIIPRINNPPEITKITLEPLQ